MDTSASRNFWLRRMAAKSTRIVKRNLRKASFYKWLGKKTINVKPDWIWRYAMAMQRTYTDSCDPWLDLSGLALDKLNL